MSPLLLKQYMVGYASSSFNLSLLLFPLSVLPTKIQLLGAFEIVSKAFLESVIVVLYLKSIQIQTERMFFENPLFIGCSIFVEIKGEATSRQNWSFD